MGFRFHNLNSISKSYISRTISSHTPKSNYSTLKTLTIPNLHNPEAFSKSDNPHYKISKRWHLGHSQSHQNPGREKRISSKESEKVFRLGLVADIGLAAGKAFTGYLTGSTAIIADAAHSVSDVVLSGVALLSFKVASAPKDKDHPYGHGKFETLGALGISGMLLATSGGISWHALDILMGLLSAAPESVNHSIHHHGGHHHGVDMNYPTLALSMTIVSISVKEGLYWITKKAGEKGGSGLMIANAWHHRSDAISSVVALLGVGGSIVGVKFLDPFAGLLVSGMILKAGLETGYQSVMELVDSAIPAQHLNPIKETIRNIEGVKGCHHLRGRRAGSSLYLDVHIEVDPFCSVSAAHEIGESVRCRIHHSHPEVSEVFIHIDPAIAQNLPQIMDQEVEINETDLQDPIDHAHVEAIISNILQSKFSEKMAVERITPHLLNGNILLQIEVSMPSDMLIRDAMQLAETAEKEILKEAPNVIRVCIQLRLGHTISTVVPKFSRDHN